MDGSNTLILAAPMFQNCGGWVLDTQFVTTMGMPYLLAHGLGRPVEDAYTVFSVAQSGKYRLFVYTFNWVAPWKKAEAPGLFEVHLNAEKVGPVFGCESPDWGWEAVYSCQLFLISSASVRSIPFLPLLCLSLHEMFFWYLYFS